MYSCSLYFPKVNLFTQPPSIFPKRENADEERIIAEIESLIDSNESKIRSKDALKFHGSVTRSSIWARGELDPSRYNSSAPSPAVKYSSTESDDSSSDTDANTVFVASSNDKYRPIKRRRYGSVRPLPPLRKPWSFTKKALVSLFTATGTYVIYRLIVKAPSYDGPEVNLKDKTVVVTEATSRMSKNLLRELAGRKATLVLTSRSMDECEDTRSWMMRNVPGLEEVQVDCRRLELDSTRSIRRFAGALRRDYPNGIDRLLIQPPSLLSGVIAGERRPTHDAFEHQLGTNFFSFYLLTRLLLPAMEKKEAEGDARVVFTIDTRAAGFAEASAERDPETGAVLLPIDNWNWAEGYTPAAGYQRAQWALRLFADELAIRGGENERQPSVLIADPLVNRTSSPEDESAGLVTRWLRNIGRGYLSLGLLVTRVAPQRAAATELMCSIATREALGLTTPPVNAPVYKKLARAIDDDGQKRADTTEARKLLWKLAEKWTHLDTHPEPVPLPPRF